VLTPFLYLWAFPATLIGLPFVLLAWLTGGHVACRDGCLEASGGWTGSILRRGLPLLGAPAAMTLGHVILARNQDCLDTSRDHEHVHVRQYERWGPLMIPLYLTASLVLWCRGYDAYLDNPFEREAYDVAD
jgi:hypothetical protein